MIDWGELRRASRAAYDVAAGQQHLPAPTPTLTASQGFYVVLLFLQTFCKAIRYPRGANRKHRDGRPVFVVPRKPP